MNTDATPQKQSWNRRSFLKIAGATTAATALPSSLLAACGGSTQGERPNKVSIMVPTWTEMPKGMGTYTNNWATRWITKHGPTQTTFVPIQQGETQLATLLSAGTAPDLMWSFWSDWKNQYIAKKNFRALDDLLPQCPEYEKLLQQYPGLKKAATAADGHIYQFGRPIPAQPNHSLFIRTDWLEKLNLHIPRTTDELLTVIKAFTDHMPELGGQGGHAIAFSAVVTMLVLDAMLQVYPFVVNDQGELDVVPWAQMEAALEFKKKAFATGGVSKDFISDKNGEVAKSEWMAGKLGIFADGIGPDPTGSKYNEWKQNNPNGSFLPIPLPRSHFGQFSPAITPPFHIMMVMNKRAANPEAAARYVNFLYSKEALYTLALDGGEKPQTDKDKCVIVDEKNGGIGHLYDLFGPLPFIGSACSSPTRTLDQKAETDPLWKEWSVIYRAAAEAYISPQRPWPQFTWVEYVPAMPQDLQAQFTTMMNSDSNNPGQIPALMTNAIIDKNLTPSQAVKQARDIWNSGGGPQIDEWWKSWYEQNKNKIFLSRDLYTAGTGIAGIS